MGGTPWTIARCDSTASGRRTSRAAGCRRSSTCPERTAKPRRAGITHVMDRGLSPLSLESLLVTAGEHIDMIKLGWGTAYVSGAVADKVAICRDAGVAVCPGGTLLEIAVHQGRLERYVEWLRELGHRPRRGLQRLAAAGALRARRS